MTSSTQENHSYERGVLWMLLSATCLSLSFLFLEINLTYVNYFLIVFLRFIVPLFFVIFLILIRKEWKTLHSSTHLPLQLLRALCVLVTQYAIAYYISKSTLLNATVLLNASPLFIPLIEWTFQGHRPGKSTILGALIAFFGVILVLQPDRSLFSAMTGVGLLAAASQASSQVLYGLRAKTENTLASLFYLFFFTSLFSLIPYLFAKHLEWGLSNSLLKEPDWVLLTMVLAMGIATVLNQYFRGLAYRCGRPSTLSTFLYFSVFVSALCDWFIFKELPTLLSFVGACLIVLGGIVKIFLRAHILKKEKNRTHPKN